jgi:predicted MFS family arabinose efflux permease
LISRALTYYLNSYKGLSREIWLLGLVNLINRCGTMVIPYMMLYLTTQLHTSISRAGIVMGLFGAGAIIGSFIGGRLTDKSGFYRIQISTLLLGGVMFITLSFLKSYFAICICTFILGAFNEAFRPANSTAMATYSTPKTRIRSFTLMRLSFNLGWAFGAAMGGFIAQHSYHLLFWIDGFTNILAAGMLLLLLPYKKPVKLDFSGDKVPEQKSVWHDKTFLAFVAISILYFSCFVQLFTNLPVFFNKIIHLNENRIGFLSAWNGVLIVIIEMTVIYWLERNWSKQKAVVIGVSLHVFAYLLLFLFDVNFLGAFMMMTLLTMSEIFAFSVLVNFWMQRTDETNRGQYAGIWTMTWAFSQSIGPLIAAYVADHHGFKVLWLGIAIVSAIAAILYRQIITD